MKLTYPIIISKDKKMLAVYIPDFDINTEGNTYADAMEMARDAIGICGITMQDDQVELPRASALSSIKTSRESDVVTLVDVDFDEYRRLSDTRTVRRNVSLQSWLDYAASKAGLNVSAICQQALMDKLNLYGPKFKEI